MTSPYLLIGYSLFLLIILVINLLYLLQIFRYRLPGDHSLTILGIYGILIIGVFIFSNWLIFS